MITVKRIMSNLDKVLPVVIISLLPVYLNSVLKFWYYIIKPLVVLLLYCGVISDISYLDKQARWAKENANVTLSAWVYSAYLLANVTDKPDLVVAAYKEDLSWLKRYLPYIGHVYVYCKSKDSCAKGLSAEIHKNPQRFSIQMLPNVGREAHTYLTHIINHYDSFSPRTVFTMGSLNISWVRELSLRYAIAGGLVFPSRPCTDKALDKIYNYRINIKHALSMGDGYDVYVRRPIVPVKIRPLGKWLAYHTGIDLQQRCYQRNEAMHGAIFSVDKSALQRIKKSQYASLLAENTVGDSLEAGYYMEVVWTFILEQH